MEEVDKVVACLLRLAALPAHTLQDTIAAFPPAIRAYFVAQADTLTDIQPFSSNGTSVTDGQPKIDCYRVAFPEPAPAPLTPTTVTISVPTNTISHPPAAPRRRSLAWVGTHQPYIGGSPEAVQQMPLKDVWFAVWIASCQYTGLSIQLGMVVCVMVYAFSFVPWEKAERVEIDYRFALIHVMMASTLLSLWSFSNAYVSWGDRASSQYLKWCFLMSVLSVSILLAIQLSWVCQGMLYYRLDLVFVVVCMIGFVVVAAILKRRYTKLGLIERLRTASQIVSTQHQFVMTFSLKQQLGITIIQTILLVGLFVLAIIFLHQDNVVIKTVLRLVVFQLLHAVALLLMRNQAVHAGTFHNKNEQQNALNRMLSTELFFNLIGRNLISNLGDSRLELLALIVAGLGDIMLRTTLYQQETLMRRLFGQAVMTPEERRQLAPIFGVMSVHATLSEYINILVAGGIKLWFAQSVLFNFGFSKDDSAGQLSVVAVTVAASLFIQFVVDLVALFLQSLQGIPIFQYWVNLSWPVLITHFLSVLGAVFFAFVAFTDAPAFYAS